MWLGGHLARSIVCTGTTTLNALQCAGKLLSEASSRSSARQHNSSGRATRRSAAGSLLFRAPSGGREPAAPADAQKRQVSHGSAGPRLPAPLEVTREPASAAKTLVVKRGVALPGSGGKELAAQPAGAPLKSGGRGECSESGAAKRATPGVARGGGGSAASPPVDQAAVRALEALQQLELVVAAAAAASSTRRVRPSAELAMARAHTAVADPRGTHSRKHTILLLVDSLTARSSCEHVRRETAAHHPRKLRQDRSKHLMLFGSSSLTLSSLTIPFSGRPQVSRQTVAALQHLRNEVWRSLPGAPTSSAALPQGPGPPLGFGVRTGSGGLAAGLIAPMASLAANGVEVVHLGGRRRGPDPPNPFAQAIRPAFDGSPCAAETPAPSGAAPSGGAAAPAGNCSRRSDQRHSETTPAAACDGGRQSASVPAPGGSPGTSPSWGHLSKYMQPRGGPTCSGSLVEVTEAAASRMTAAAVS